jgi:hypothetical protein
MHTGDQRYAAIGRTRQQDHAVAELLLELIHAVAQRLGVETFQPCRHDLDAVDVLGRTGQIGDGRTCRLAAQRIQLALSFFWRSNSCRSFSTASSPLLESSCDSSPRRRSSSAT